MKKIGICNNKGGVGKTTISLCLAGTFAEMDLKVLLVDKGSDLTAASSMFVMAYTAGMVVRPLFCSLSMQVAGPFGLLALFAIARFFLFFWS